MSERVTASLPSGCSRGRRVWALVMMASLSLTAPRTAEAEPQADEAESEDAKTNARKVIEAVAGRWRFVGGKREREELATEIEKVVDGMTFFKRPFARPRLHKGNEIPENLVISLEGDVVGIDMDNNRYRAKLDGRWEQGHGSGGSELRYRHVIDRGRLVQIFDAARGKRFNWFVRTGADRLKMVVKVVSSHFSEPLVYELTYVRKQPTRDGARRRSSGDAS